MSALELREATKLWPGGGGLRDFSVEVEPGKIVVVVGPSGCGKSTALRVASGLTSPDSGRVFVEGRDVTDEPPERRGLGVVFQHYALFPNLDVEGNVAFGLRARGVGRNDASGAAREALELVGLSNKRSRKLDALSGGEQQRVAVARAIAFKPKVLLFDEPLSNLDLALRRRTREDLAKLVRDLNLAALYVTHDQEEACAVADDVVVVRAGRIEQKGPPERLFAEPNSAFVARFLGGSNVLSGRRTAANEVEIDLGLRVEARPEGPMGESVDVAWRPEDVLPEAAENRAAAFVVAARTFLGADVLLSLERGALRIEARLRASEAAANARIGDAVVLRARKPCRVVLKDAAP
jgi:ABC-type Fe3+/spermidine/putrescine transport system ATPase subunit